MHHITVRPETPEDVRAIDVANLSAFESETEARLVSAMRALAGFSREHSLVAEYNGRIVGHVLLTPVRFETASGNRNLVALGPMSVVPSQSHRGIGAELVKAAIAKARVLGFGAIVIVGQPEYYARFGFGAASQWGLHTTPPASERLITAMELTPGALTGGGRVVFPSQFAEIF